MLIQFSVGNFLSFKDIVTLSMVASSKNEHDEDNTFKINNKMRLLKSAVIYGANGSGKSNLFKAMNFMRSFIFNSSKEYQAVEEINISNFKLNTEYAKSPAVFEIIFIHEGIKYRYGFEIDRTKIYKEWLFFLPKTKETKLFIRDENKFDIGNQFKEGKKLEEKTRPNSLFLSVVAQFNGEISIKILDWFKSLNIISGLNDSAYIHYTIRNLRDEYIKSKIMDFISLADLGIKSISLEQKKLTQEELDEKYKKIPENMKKAIIEDGINMVSTIHEKYDKENKVISLEKFQMDLEESEGTKKIFALSAPIIDTLRNGTILIVDELDARLHPILTKFIIQLFNSKKTNIKNAQLIFASHDTNSLNRSLFRRDQIWFMEKDKYGATDLYSLIEYKEIKVRKDASYGKDYIQGKYGAIPFIGSINNLIN